MDQIAMDFRADGDLRGILPRLRLEASPAGITRVTLPRARPSSPAAPVGRAAEILHKAWEELAEYLAGARTFFSVPTDLSRVPRFDREALEVTARIPYGQVRTYKWIAEQLGAPLAARAVGGAMAGNPVPLIIPCHRVVRSDGGLGGYSFGLVQKEALLILERGTAPCVAWGDTRIVCRRGCTEERRNREGERIHFATLADARQSDCRPCPLCRPA
jgi:methylated-DNA-[protein]-cysteine S-methyltransferase